MIDIKYYVYIIQSEVDNSFYKGFSINPNKRLTEHNALQSEYTSKKAPWKLVFIQSFSSKKEALIREKAIKKFSTSSLINLLYSPLNELKENGNY